jgi:Arylsulfotransferase (ASST)
VLPNGNVLWHGGNTSPPKWATYRLNGTRVRTLPGVGRGSDAHDLQLAANGDHLIGAYVWQGNVDTSAYGGSADATVINAELQQVSPQGTLVWSWRSQHHIGREETGRWWPRVVSQTPYDLLHWNSIEPAGSAVIASFRHLDAVYKIDKRTDQIVWKLGGTRTPESLRVLNDPRSYTLGAQHDARLLPDRTVTVFDNRSRLNQRPRAVRFRIDEEAGTATLIQSITDPAVFNSGCCGSARRLANGDWLINWGGPSNRTSGYKANGQRTFTLKIHASYRSEPVPEGVLTAQELRQGMNAMYGGP